MLIFTHSRAIDNVVKYLFILFILGSLYACADKSDDNPIASKESEPLTHEAGEQANAKLTDINPDVSRLEDEPLNADLADESPTLETPNPVIAEVQDKKSLVEDFGFSEAQLGDKTATETSTAKLFCLDSQNETENELSIEDACRKISKRLASVKYAACEAAKLKKTGCSSVNGFPILMSEFAPLEEKVPQGRILIVGGTHGDELTSVSMTLRWIEKLNDHHSGLFHWHLIPMMNPDGVLKSGATRTNDNGVDLNRNMPSDDWGQNAIKYWVEKGGKDPRKYPGESPSSEPETQWLIDEIETFRPDAIISVHAPYGVVDFDSLLLNTAPKSLGKLHLNLLGTYPGSLGNYAGINRNIPVITLELPHSWVMPSEAESTKIWEDIVSWLKQNINTEVAQN